MAGGDRDVPSSRRRAMPAPPRRTSNPRPRKTTAAGAAPTTTTPAQGRQAAGSSIPRADGSSRVNPETPASAGSRAAPNSEGCTPPPAARAQDRRRAAEARAAAGPLAAAARAALAVAAWHPQAAARRESGQSRGRGPLPSPPRPPSRPPRPIVAKGRRPCDTPQRRRRRARRRRPLGFTRRCRARLSSFAAGRAPGATRRPAAASSPPRTGSTSPRSSPARSPVRPRAARACGSTGRYGRRPRRRRQRSSSPRRECRRWHAAGRRERCCSEGRSPLPLARSIRTPPPITSAARAEFSTTPTTCRRWPHPDEVRRRPLAAPSLAAPLEPFPLWPQCSLR